MRDAVKSISEIQRENTDGRASYLYVHNDVTMFHVYVTRCL